MHRDLGGDSRHAGLGLVGRDAEVTVDRSTVHIRHTYKGYVYGYIYRDTYKNTYMGFI